MVLEPPGRREANEARKLGRKAARLARRAAQLDRAEEQRVKLVQRSVAVQQALPADEAGPRLEAAAALRSRPALLIVNSKSGPRKDSLMRVRELVTLLTAYGIRAEVRVKLSKAQARAEARGAARRGFPLVIAAGGDGTVEAVARGLVGSRTALGIIPLGTYNNVAHSLGIPDDVSSACALLGTANPRSIDMAQVEVRGRKRPRPYLEMATIGLGASLIPLGQHAEKGRWAEAMNQLPQVLSMSPTGALLRLDDAPEPWWAHTLLATVSNTPLAGAALRLAPEAQVDDGLLDLCVYDELEQGDLATRLLALKAGTATDDQHVRRARAQRVEIHTERPLPVAADSKIIGATPARFSIMPGALLAIVGDTQSLVRPATPTVVAMARAQAEAPPSIAPASAPRSALALPGVARPLVTLGRSALPLATAIAVAAFLRRRSR